MLPVAHAEEPMSSTFDPIFADKSPGGILVGDVIRHVHNQNQLKVPLHLTQHGLDHSRRLITMLNDLPCVGSNSSKFMGDNYLFDFLSSQYQYTYRYTMDTTSSIILPTQSFDLPLGRQIFPHGMNTGIYAFIHDTGNTYIGSNIAFRPRLINHLECFRGEHKPTYMHTWIMDNGGLSRTRWAPLIDWPNLTLEWSRHHPTDVLSKGVFFCQKKMGMLHSRLSLSIQLVF